MIETPEKILEEMEGVLKSVEGAYTIWLSYALKLMHLEFSEKTLRKTNANDILSGITEKFLDGKRNWDSEKYPDFYRFMFLVIKSEISNLAKLKDRLVYDHFEKLDYRAKELERKEEFESLSKFELHKENEIADFEDNDGKHDLIDRCFDALNGKDEEEVFVLIMEGKKTRHISAELHWENRKVEAVIKRIKRKAEPIIFNYFREKRITLPPKIASLRAFSEK